MSKDEAVKAAILRAANRLFQKYGITKTAMEDIAREAGKGKSTLYYYFKSKTEVLDAMAEAYIDQMTGVAQEETAGKPTAREKLLAYLLTMLREIRRLMAPLRIERDLPTVRVLVSRVVGKFDAKNAKAVESILRFGLEREEFRSIRPADLKATTAAIVVLTRSLTFNLFLDNRDKRLIDSIIRLMSEGL